MDDLSKILTHGNYWREQFIKFESKYGVALYLNELDKICPTIQALNYSKSPDNNKNLEEFYPYARKKLKTKKLIDLLDYMHSITIPDHIDAYDIYFSKLKSITL